MLQRTAAAVPQQLAGRACSSSCARRRLQPPPHIRPAATWSHTGWPSDCTTTTHTWMQTTARSRTVAQVRPSPCPPLAAKNIPYHHDPIMSIPVAPACRSGPLGSTFRSWPLSKTMPCPLPPAECTLQAGPLPATWAWWWVCAARRCCWRWRCCCWAAPTARRCWGGWWSRCGCRARPAHRAPCPTPACWSLSKGGMRGVCAVLLRHRSCRCFSIAAGPAGQHRAGLHWHNIPSRTIKEGLSLRNTATHRQLALSPSSLLPPSVAASSPPPPCGRRSPPT